MDAVMRPWQQWLDLQGGALRSAARLHSRVVPDDLPFALDGGGGRGGHRYHGTPPGTDRTPVVLVHGMYSDVRDMAPVEDHLLEQGYGGDAVWSVGFADASPSIDAMADTLDRYVEGVLQETGAEAVDLVGHSLGGIGVQAYLDRAPETVETAVTVAAPHHGSALNDIGRCYGMPVRDDLSRRSARDGPLADLPEDVDGVDQYTVRGAHDGGYPVDTDSPALPGADENVELPYGHHAVLAADETLACLDEWLG